MFETTSPHYCPVCPPVLSHNQKRRLDGPLVLAVRNYSGCSVDFADCPTCGKRFQISYKVDTITEIKPPKKVREFTDEQLAVLKKLGDEIKDCSTYGQAHEVIANYIGMDAYKAFEALELCHKLKYLN